MEISVRKATAADYGSVCELFNEMDALHRDNLPHIFQQPNGAAREEDYYLGLVADASVALLLAEVGGDVVGFVHAAVRDTPAIPVFVPRRYAVVDGIAVRPAFQNQGIGRRLMEGAQAWAIARGATSIQLNVYEFNEPAISFYEGLSYRTLSRKMSRELEAGKAA